MNSTAMAYSPTTWQYRVAIEKRLGTLPLLPAVVSRLLSLNPEQDDYLDEVYKLARQDPTLSIRLVEYATRTIAYESSRDRLDLRYAIVRLGTRKIAGLVVGLALLESFEPKTQAERDLWVHSVEVAVVARHLAAMMPDLRVDPEQLYLGGLLHDIGRFIVFQAVPEAPARVDEAGWSDPVGLIEAELSAIGIDHTEVGREACTQWGIPDALLEIIANHHRYDLPADTPDDRRLCNRVCLIQIADALSFRLMRICVGNPQFDTRQEREAMEEQIQGLIDRFVDGGFWRFSLKYRLVLARQLAGGIGPILRETRSILNGLGVEHPAAGSIAA